MPYNKLLIKLDRSVFTVKYQTEVLPYRSSVSESLLDIALNI